MQSLSIVAALAVRARTRAQVRALQEKPLIDGRAVATDRARASAESLGGRAPKAGAAAV